MHRLGPQVIRGATQFSQCNPQSGAAMHKKKVIGPGLGRKSETNVILWAQLHAEVLRSALYNSRIQSSI